MTVRSKPVLLILQLACPFGRLPVQQMLLIRWIVIRIRDSKTDGVLLYFQNFHNNFVINDQPLIDATGDDLHYAASSFVCLLSKDQQRDVILTNCVRESKQQFC